MNLGSNGMNVVVPKEGENNLVVDACAFESDEDEGEERKKRTTGATMEDGNDRPLFPPSPISSKMVSTAVPESGGQSACRLPPLPAIKRIQILAAWLD